MAKCAAELLYSSALVFISISSCQGQTHKLIFPPVFLPDQRGRRQQEPGGRVRAGADQVSGSVALGSHHRAVQLPRAGGSARRPHCGSDRQDRPRQVSSKPYYYHFISG